MAANGNRQFVHDEITAKARSCKSGQQQRTDVIGAARDRDCV